MLAPDDFATWTQVAGRCRSASEWHDYAKAAIEKRGGQWSTAQLSIHARADTFTYATVSADCPTSNRGMRPFFDDDAFGTWWPGAVIVMLS